jgi:hypothetical protein
MVDLSRLRCRFLLSSRAAVSALHAIPCPRCGKAWIKWAGSKLPCHARCLFTPELQDDIYQLRQRFVRLTADRLAADLGVPIGVIRVALTEGARRDGKCVSMWGR